MNKHDEDVVRVVQEIKKESAMVGAMEFTIGAEVSCSDGPCGKVSRVVVDPVARALTHLVVEPKHGQGDGRLVPLALVDSTTSELRLQCTIAEFKKLDPAEEIHFMEDTGSYGPYEAGGVVTLPYYPLGSNVAGGGLIGSGIPGSRGGGLGHHAHAVTYDYIPLGEVTVRRGDQVHATDGDIGHVQGLVINPSDHTVSHVLLQEGHPWGRKEVAIPIGAVTQVTSGIQLSLTKQEVQDLPPVDVGVPGE